MTSAISFLNLPDILGSMDSFKNKIIANLLGNLTNIIPDIDKDTKVNIEDCFVDKEKGVVKLVFNAKKDDMLIWAIKVDILNDSRKVDIRFSKDFVFWHTFTYTVIEEK